MTKGKKVKIIFAIIAILLVVAAVVILFSLRTPYKKIYNDYAVQMETVSAEYLDKLSQAKNSGIFNLAAIQGEGVNKLALLNTVGLEEMIASSNFADFIIDTVLGSYIDTGGYAKWGGKLSEKYMEEATKITDKYMELTGEKLNF